MIKKIAITSVLSLFSMLAVDNRIDFQVINTNKPKTRADYFEDYAKLVGINTQYLKALCKHENPKEDVKAVNKNKNGTLDIGLCQVNTRTAKDLLKLKPEQLKEERTNIYAMAKIAKHKVDAFKNSKKPDDNVVRRVNGYDDSKSNKNYTRDVVNLWVTMR